MRKIVLTTIGTLGDLHPFIAIGLALKARGFRPVLAVAEDQIAKSQAAGLEAVAILPSFGSIGKRLGLSDEDAVRLLMSDQRHVLEEILLPALASSTEALDAVAEGAEAIVSSTFVFAAPTICEKRGIPLISVLLQPMALLSPYDPPATPDFWMVKRSPVGRVGATWNKIVYGFGRRYFQRRYAERIDAVRAEHGLPKRGAARMFETARGAALTLGCYSRHFGPPPRDAYPNLQVVGFPVFDSQTGREDTLDPALAAFLDAGPPPLVFTLGTFAVHGAGEFYIEAAETARRLGQRAVLLTGVEPAPMADGDVFRCAYAPHSLLFPRASVVIHHGGAGTTGQALRAGKPQLVVPHFGDQNDHGRRVERLGLGLVLRASRLTAARAAPLLARLLAEPRFGAEATQLAVRMASEDGAGSAAAAIERTLDVLSGMRPINAPA